MDNKEFTTVQIQGIDAQTLLQKFENLETQIKGLQTAKPETSTEKLITRFEASQLLGVSLVTVHNWTKANILRAYRIGNKVRFKESEVFNALQSINSK